MKILCVTVTRRTSFQQKKVLPVKHLALLFSVFMLFQVTADAQPALTQPMPASAQQLAAITARGRALEAYDQAAWHGTDAAVAVVGSDQSGLKYYIARQMPSGWTVDFGTLDPAGAAFLTAIEAVSPDGQHFTAKRLTPPRSDTGFLVTPLTLFKPPRPPSNPSPALNITWP